MIRLATQGDVSRIVEMGAAFHEEAGWSDICVYDAETCATSISNMIDLHVGFVLVVEEGGRLIGMAGGVVSPLYFNHTHKSGQELFFWMEPGSRCGTGRELLAEMEDEARRQGCESWVMIALDKVRPAATGMLYKRGGYRASEHSWIKRL